MSVLLRTTKSQARGAQEALAVLSLKALSVDTYASTKIRSIASESVAHHPEEDWLDARHSKLDCLLGLVGFSTADNLLLLLLLLLFKDCSKQP
jgi:hypothetical protein